MEKSWAILDQKKEGFLDLEGFKRGLAYIGIYVTKEELKYAFTFIDRNTIGSIKYLDFVDFWVVGESKLLSTPSMSGCNAPVDAIES